MQKDSDIKSSVNYQEHWDKAYTKIKTEKLGWYEDYPETSLELIKNCNLSTDSRIFNEFKAPS